MVGNSTVPVSGSRTVVRLCRWSELLAVYQIHRACFPYPYGFGRFLGYQMSSQGHILVALARRTIAGYLIGATSELLSPSRRVGEIISVAVLDPWRRQGLGTQLIVASVARLAARGLDEVYLQVAVSNESAQELYEHLGFQRRDRLPRYYLSGEDAWLMVRPMASGATPEPSPHPAGGGPGAV